MARGGQEGSGSLGDRRGLGEGRGVALGAGEARRRKTTQHDIEKLIPVAATIPTTAAASLCRLKKARWRGRISPRVKFTRSPGRC